ncbi:torsin-1A-like [Stegodyphus dumicola]|uniref:torsin-1A-like n=1 Tax=Stegodyphus dumicola TaxID=202533 RepID=UPI0015AEA7D0|nr:torsin-1A-like [Stegodyphus dumicola]
MKMYPVLIKCLIFIVIFLNVSQCVVDPITALGTIGGFAGIAGFAGFAYLYCKYEECCDKNWIAVDLNALESELNSKLFGQHLVKFVIPKAIAGHVKKKNPPKALVLSFHGWTGTGKNFVSDIIANTLFKKGLESQYVHKYIGPLHFPHKQDILKYKDKLRTEIPKFTKHCEKSLFIFDEVDKIPAGVLDVLTPFLDYHDSVDGVDYRRSIFIFLSNSGGSNITKIATQFWAEGKEREMISIKDMERLISSGAYNEIGGMHRSEIVRKQLIDIYVPFLPLEKKHVKQCIKSELLSRKLKVDDDSVNIIANQLLYEPSNIELFSTSGCKKISQKIDIYI